MEKFDVGAESLCMLFSKERECVLDTKGVHMHIVGLSILLHVTIF